MIRRSLLLSFAGLLAWVAAPLQTLKADNERPFPRPSWFNSAKISRDPFTPIDSLEMDKTLVVDSASQPGQKLDLTSLFKVSSISIGQLSIAIINNRAFAEGEAFDLRGEGKEVKRVTVLKINDGSVLLDYSGRKVTVQLFRKEPVPLEDR